MSKYCFLSIILPRPTALPQTVDQSVCLCWPLLTGESPKMGMWELEWRWASLINHSQFPFTLKLHPFTYVDGQLRPCFRGTVSSFRDRVFPGRTLLKAPRYHLAIITCIIQGYAGLCSKKLQSIKKNHDAKRRSVSTFDSIYRRKEMGCGAKVTPTVHVLLHAIVSLNHLKHLYRRLLWWCGAWRLSKLLNSTTRLENWGFRGINYTGQ